MNNNASDIELVDQVKEENNEQALKELVHRHSGVYVNMVKRFGRSGLSETEISDILNEKNYNIYLAAIKYKKEKSKFSTFLANNTKYICLTKKTRYKRNKETVCIDDIDFLLESESLDPDSFCLFSDTLQSVLSLISNNKDERVHKIFTERYFGGDFNKPQPWNRVSKKLGLSSQACINIHNKTVKQIKSRINNDTIKF
jgi:DNA-directed RNA polymerase specialized sigma24 family protein